MATITRVELIDDLDGGKGDETLTFGIDGSLYEIDLAHNNAELLRDSLAKFVDAGRRVGTLKGGQARRFEIPNPQGRKPARMDKSQRLAIREWANANGFTIGDRGRIPEAILEAFEQAHKVQ